MLGTSRALSAASALPRSARLRHLAIVAVVGTLLYGALAPLLAVVHELIVLGTAFMIGDLAWYAATSGLLRLLPLDPIYTGAMLLTLGGIEPLGLALAEPLGLLLHDRWPSFFQSPAALAASAWASAVVAPGSTIVSRWLCRGVADAALIGLGLAATWQARPTRRWLLVAGAILQAHVVVTHLVDAPPDLAEVEAAGVPFAIAMIVSGDVQAGPRLSETLEALSEPVRNLVLGLGMAALTYLPVLAVLLAVWLVRTVRQRARPSWAELGAARVGLRAASTAPRGLSLRFAQVGKLLVVGALALAVALSPLGALADGETRFLSASLDEDPLLHDGALAAEPGTLLTGDGSSVAHASAPNAASPAPQVAGRAIPATASVVAVTGSGYRYQYTVNGVPQVIRGMGYNVQYSKLPQDERVRRLERDLAELRKAGVNTVFGWEQDEFDGILLDVAHRHGLGVAPPFELDPEATYGDPAVRERLIRETVSWVQQYKAHPAVRMWAIGNEVLHKLVYPSWMPLRSDPAWEQRARDFAVFYVQLIDAVHAVDPDHPIVHRDAEDAYLAWLRDVMQANPPTTGAGAASGRRPWFIYGVNSYTPRLAEILTSWPQQGWDVPLLVSEFAPGGMSPADRPQGLRDMWKMVRGANGWVLGGSVYAWTTDGPEEVDRVFGLVDGEGQAIDGALGAISAVYRGAARQAHPARTTPAQPGDARVWRFATYVISAIQEGRSTDLLPATTDTSIMGDVNSVSQAVPADAELTVQRVRDQRRIAWARESGVLGEWWVTWQPPATPQLQLAFTVQEHADGTLGVQYIYHGPR
jgi:hypothetical protein